MNALLSRSARFAFLAAAVLAPLPARAQQLYNFTSIATTRPGGGFSDLGLAPNLNSAGRVVFDGQRANGGASGVFAGSGGSAFPGTLVTNGAGSGFAGFSFSSPRINDANTVVFRAASADTGENGIYRSSGAAGGPIGTVTDNAGNFSNVFAPTLNNAGQVAFAAVTADPGGAGVFRTATVGGGAPVTIASAAAGDFSTVGQRVALNPNGQVALVASRDSSAPGGTHLLVGGGAGAPISALDASGSPLAAFDLAAAPQLSVDGTLTFLATRDDGARGIFQFDGLSVRSLVDTGAGLFSDIRDFSVAGGRFAFLGVMTPTLLDPDGTTGIFNGANPLLNRIVAEGDLLPVGASRVAVDSLAFADGGLNAAGQVAFYAGFGDAGNTAAIFRADVVPEPRAAALALLGGGALAAGWTVRRRRRGPAQWLA